MFNEQIQLKFSISSPNPSSYDRKLNFCSLDAKLLQVAINALNAENGRFAALIVNSHISAFETVLSA